MPLTVKKRGNKFRVIEKGSGLIAKNKGNTAMDGGGFSSKSKATAQAAAVNISQARQRGANIPRKKKS